MWQGLVSAGQDALEGHAPRCMAAIDQNEAMVEAFE